MKKKNFLVYDPQFIGLGHYIRFNKYILEMLCKIDETGEVIYLGKKIYKNRKIKFKKLDSLSSFNYRYYSKLKKIFFLFISTFKTLNIVFTLNKHHKNKTLILLSEGGIFFNFFMLIFYKGPYLIYTISIENFFKKGFIGFLYKKIYRINYLKSKVIIVTNKISRRKLIKMNIKNVFILPERYL